jgi:hypothetical protein
MKTFTTPKALMVVLLCYGTIIIFSSFLVEVVHAHSVGSAAGGINNHEHGRIISVSELFLSVTPVSGGLALAITLLLWKRK